MQLDASTKSLLNREVAFNEIVPLRDTLGLNLSLTQKATVADWYVAYAAATKLAESGKTFSTLSNVNLSADVEKALQTASVERIRRQLTADARKFVQGKLDAAPAPIKVVIGSEFNATPFGSQTTSSIAHASRLIDEAAGIAPSSSTIQSIVSLLMKARNELREVAYTLRAEADVRQIAADDSSVTSAWTALTSASDKASVEAAAKTIAGIKTDGVTSWESVIEAQLPTEHSALTSALDKFAKVVNTLPKELVDTEFSRRATFGDVAIDA